MNHGWVSGAAFYVLSREANAAASIHRRRKYVLQLGACDLLRLCGRSANRKLASSGENKRGKSHVFPWAFDAGRELLVARMFSSKFLFYIDNVRHRMR